MIRLVFVVLLATGFAFPAGATRNVALASEGAVAAADSESVHSPYRDAGDITAYVNDGVWIGPGDPPEKNRWCASLSLPHPHWVWIRFRQPARITRVVIHRADLLHYPVDFAGEYSPDGGETLHTLFRVTGNRMSKHTFAVKQSFAPVVTDNFRLWIDRSSQQEHPGYVELSEIEVFGDYVDTGPERERVEATISAAAPVLEPTREDDVVITCRDGDLEFRSPWLRFATSLERPRITALCWDSLGEGRLDKNLLKPGETGGGRLEAVPLFAAPVPTAPVSIEQEGNVVRYETRFAGSLQVRWEFRVQPKVVRTALSWAIADAALFRVPPSMQFAFDVGQTPVAPFANPRPGTPAPLPCLLHAADCGSLLIDRTDGGHARMDAQRLRGVRQWNARLVEQTGGRADGLYSVHAGVHRWEMALSMKSVLPLPELVRDEPRLCALPRHWLNVFQYRPDIGILSNNIVSDNAAFCMFTFTDPAVFTPPLPGGVDAIQLARESLDRYFAGAPGYGVNAESFMDTDPALLISAWDVVLVTGDLELLQRWLPHLERHAEHLESLDHDGNGLPEGPRSGNRGDQLNLRFRVGNWWDCINFGYEDAYACALAYRAFRGLADLERLANRPDQASHYQRAAEKIRAAYLPTFLNPETGILAGWKSRDGQLHDYWFVFVNGMAIAYGLVPETEANAIVDRIQAKIKEVGYSRFDLGLPGNLAPIAKNDHTEGSLGAPQADDGRDTYGAFENGGATACYAYFYIQALYQLGRREEADRILWPMMRTYAVGGFQNGVGNGGEWRRWDGTPSGYEGFLADAYHAQMAVFTGYYGIGFGADGFRLEPWSPLLGNEVPLGLKHMGKVVRAVGP
jgi:hypothetical protein